jgi:hypothetical protein
MSGQHAKPKQIDRRDLRRTMSVGAAILAVTALATAGVAGADGAVAAANPAAPSATYVIGPDGATPEPTANPAAQPTTDPSGSPDGRASAAPEVSADPTPATPALRIALSYQRRDRDLLLTISFDGYVYNPYGLNDNTLVAYPTPAGRNIGMGEQLTWGDGTEYTVSGGPQRCANPGEQNVLHQLKDSYQLHKKYKKSGEYTIGYTYFACGLTGGKIAGTLTIKVP